LHAKGDRQEATDVEMRVVPVDWSLSGPAHVRAIQARSAITLYDRVNCLSGKKWFSPQCVSFSLEGKKVVLINGNQLAEFVVDRGLGVTTTKAYEIREVSNDFFDESEV
jgi:hypothetical protein